MKNKNIIIYYLKDWRVILGLLCILTGLFAPREGKVYRSRWDDSIRYQKPMDSDMQKSMYAFAAVSIFFGLKSRWKKLNNTPPTDDNQDTKNT
jgi:hypothetical protein